MPAAGIPAGGGDPSESSKSDARQNPPVGAWCVPGARWAHCLESFRQGGGRQDAAVSGSAGRPRARSSPVAVRALRGVGGGPGRGLCRHSCPGAPRRGAGAGILGSQPAFAAGCRESEACGGLGTILESCL